MKKVELVHLNPKQHVKRVKDLEDAQNAINAKIAEGWELMQIISPNDFSGAMIGVFVREE